MSFKRSGAVDAWNTPARVRARHAVESHEWLARRRPAGGAWLPEELDQPAALAEVDLFVRRSVGMRRVADRVDGEPLRAERIIKVAGCRCTVGVHGIIRPKCDRSRTSEDQHGAIKSSAASQAFARAADRAFRRIARHLSVGGGPRSGGRGTPSLSAPCATASGGGEIAGGSGLAPRGASVGLSVSQAVRANTMPATRPPTRKRRATNIATFLSAEN